jgi:lysozyme family protein
MADFEKAISRTLSNEGGYSNDSTDLGGETKFGISKRAYPKEDIKNLTIERAKSIYKTDYWDKIKGDQVNSQVIANSIFDFAVNAGVKTSIKLAQNIVSVLEDGIIGVKTINALNSIPESNFKMLSTLKKIQRYIDICQKNPNQKKYFFGWIKRSMEI